MWQGYGDLTSHHLHRPSSLATASASLGSLDPVMPQSHSHAGMVAWGLPSLRQRPSATIPQDPVTMLIPSPPPASLLPCVPVTITSEFCHLHQGHPFSPITRSPSPEFHQPVFTTRGSQHPTAYPDRLFATRPAHPPQPLRLFQDSPTCAPKTPGPQRAPRQGQRRPSRKGRGRGHGRFL